MELIVTSFVAVTLSLLGHLAMVISDNLRRPKTAGHFIVRDPGTPPPRKVSRLTYTAASQEPVAV